MLRFSPPITLLAAVTFCGILGHNTPALADNFRVDNAVFVENEKKPSSQSVTIFADGVVYDCMKAPAEIVVFDKPAEKFVLLNQASRTRAELTTRDVAAFVRELQPLAAKNPDPLVKFLANPKFEDQYNAATGELTFSSPMMTYRLLLSTDQSQAAVDQYREFSDWYARLNTMLSPGSRPPFGRLMVNAAVAQRKAIASEVTLAISTVKENRGQTTIRSTHKIARQLTQGDLDYVATIRKSMSDYKLVGFDKYRKTETK